jgi:hypothetical protein
MWIWGINGVLSVIFGAVLTMSGVGASLEIFFSEAPFRQRLREALSSIVILIAGLAGVFGGIAGAVVKFGFGGFEGVASVPEWPAYFAAMVVLFDLTCFGSLLWLELNVPPATTGHKQAAVYAGDIFLLLVCAVLTVAQSWVLWLYLTVPV